MPAATHIVHPGAAALAVARRGVEVELADELALALQAVKLHGGVPNGRLVALDLHLKQRFDDFEQARQHARRRKVLLDLLLAEGVARFLEFFADVAPVPRLRVGQLQVVARKVAQVLHVLLGKGAGFGGQVAQKGQHLLGAVGHFGHERHLGKARVAQQLRLFLSQRQQLADDGAVVELFGIALGLLAGAGGVGAVELFAQGAAAGELHHRQVAGDFEGELVAIFALGLGSSACRVDHVLRQAVQLGQAGVIGPLVGGIERVFAKLLRQLGLAFLNLGKALFGAALQFGAAQHKAAQGVFVRLALFGIKRGGVNGFVFGIQRLVGAQCGRKLGHGRQHGVESSAQLGRVAHAFEVAHGAPGAAQAFGGYVQRGGQALPVGRKVGLRDLLKRSLRLLQQLRDGGLNLLGRNGVKARQVGKVEQGVGVVGGVGCIHG